METINNDEAKKLNYHNLKLKIGKIFSNKEFILNSFCSVVEMDSANNLYPEKVIEIKKSIDVKISGKGSLKKAQISKLNELKTFIDEYIIKPKHP